MGGSIISRGPLEQASNEAPRHTCRVRELRTSDALGLCVCVSGRCSWNIFDDVRLGGCLMVMWGLDLGLFLYWSVLCVIIGLVYSMGKNEKIIQNRKIDQCDFYEF